MNCPLSWQDGTPLISGMSSFLEDEMNQLCHWLAEWQPFHLGCCQDYINYLFHQLAVVNGTHSQRDQPTFLARWNLVRIANFWPFRKTLFKKKEVIYCPNESFFLLLRKDDWLNELCHWLDEWQPFHLGRCQTLAIQSKMFPEILFHCEPLIFPLYSFLRLLVDVVFICTLCKMQ